MLATSGPNGTNTGYEKPDLDYFYAWWMDGGPNNAASTTKDTTLGIAMSPTQTLAIQNKYGDNWTGYLNLNSDGTRSASGTPSLPPPTKQGNVPGTGFVNSVTSAEADLGAAVNSILGGTGQNQQQPPPRQTTIIGPPPLLIFGFLTLAVGLTLLILGVTEPKHK
jgi:hypothetical protein